MLPHYLIISVCLLAIIIIAQLGTFSPRGKERKKTTITVAAADVDTDASGNVDITFPDLVSVELDTVDVRFTGTVGYEARAHAVAGNVVSCRVYADDDTGATGIVEPPSHDSATDVGILYGYAEGF